MHDYKLLAGIAVKAAIILCVLLRLYRSTRREMDLASGMDVHAVRQYYRHLLHKRPEAQAYRDARRQKLGIGECLAEPQVLRLQAKQIANRRHPSIWEQANLDCQPYRTDAGNMPQGGHSENNK